MSSNARVFRHDINGLRAWAVIAVVLFHFGVPGFVGGFVGVDVFFVISGFLMTQIIVSGIESGNFSLWRFYLARARDHSRIVGFEFYPTDSRLVFPHLCRLQYPFKACVSCRTVHFKRKVLERIWLF